MFNCHIDFFVVCPFLFFIVVVHYFRKLYCHIDCIIVHHIKFVIVIMIVIRRGYIPTYIICQFIYFPWNFILYVIMPSAIQRFFVKTVNMLLCA